ncbi:RhtB (resistance to homoserine/threonine) family protein [Desulfomicrobium macestii]|uniref:Resistance to homoserine/threonine (RhtB) family protein n=2 Tax=Desulfomicrobium TaxID=898 RepID=A0A8G2BZN2_DESNO|nr:MULTISPECIES: LysE family transporter [Desulfomicrobium]MBE1423382.1 RhtB (resistance to homoserine/threonine) family protein [Desulfomicrobium macestii]SFL26899.1 resistance to homoserine/threonine (RhtB) family protein [Desulfomicrobium norvegicum]
MDNGFWQVFAVGVAVAVAPGPDFFMVLRNSLSRGRLAGVMTALGIGSALVVHVVYSVLGLALVIASSPAVFGLIRICGALYLIHIAVRCLFGKKTAMPDACVQVDAAGGRDSLLRGWREGFWCNLLNPKAALFFLSIFSQFMTPATPNFLRWVYGAEVIVIVTAWFTLLALFLSTGRMRGMYAGVARWIDGGVGVIFGGVGCSILWQEARRVL